MKGTVIQMSTTTTTREATAADKAAAEQEQIKAAVQSFKDSIASVDQANEHISALLDGQAVSRVYAVRAIVRLNREHGVSQVKLATMTGVSRGTVQNYLKAAKDVPAFDTIRNGAPTQNELEAVKAHWGAIATAEQAKREAAAKAKADKDAAQDTDGDTDGGTDAPDTGTVTVTQSANVSAQDVLESMQASAALLQRYVAEFGFSSGEADKLNDVIADMSVAIDAATAGAAA